jgi:uncharacterized protein (UPF0371 family)
MVKEELIMKKIAFDNNKYLELQSQQIQERINQFDNKLYLEFGGKLFDDHHASRVLLGFQPDSKLQMLLKLVDKVEVVVVINAFDIARNKVRADLGISYEDDVLRLIDAFQNSGLYVGSVVITQFKGQEQATSFRIRLEKLGITVYYHYPIVGYPTDLKLIVSDEGYGKNEYIETSRPLVVVTAPGPGSGKMAVCLSQLYHDYMQGYKSGYAKFETFPIWNLPLQHPVNLAYEAATADLNDINMIDPFHYEAYQKVAVNYNRDIEVFPVLNAILEKIAGKSPYQSPTDMGVNMAGYCIIDDELSKYYAKQEIIRRYYHALVQYKFANGTSEAIEKIEKLMNQLSIGIDDRPVVRAALAKAEHTGFPAIAIELPDGKIITAKTSSLLGASAALFLNALKYLAGIEDNMLLLSPSVIEPIQKMKTDIIGNSNPRLHANEILIALAIAASTNPFAQLAMLQMNNLKHCEVHSTVLLPATDEYVFRKLQMNLTCEPFNVARKLYRK